MTRRRRRETHSEAFWSRHIQDWRESGLTQQAYCELHGLAASTFHARRRRLAVNGSPRNDVAAATQFEIVPLGTPIIVSRPRGAGYWAGCQSIRAGDCERTVSR